MANSSSINAGDDALASQYNNLRDDVLDETTGHQHTGSGDGIQISTSGIEDDAITEAKAQSVYNKLLGFGFIY